MTMKTFGEMYEVLEELDRMVGELNYEGFEGTVVGGGALMYHVDRADADLDRKGTDDLDLVTNDLTAVTDLAKKYGNGPLGTSATRIPLSSNSNRYLDFTWDHPLGERIQELRERGEMYEVEGLENISIEVIPPEAFIQEKSKLHREKDERDVELMKKILEDYGE